MKRSRLLRAVLAAAVVFLPSAARSGDDAQGKVLFEQTCSMCHAADGTGVQGLGRNLTTSEFVAKKSDDELVKFINEGRAANDPLNTTGVLMPPKAGNPALTDDDIHAIVRHLRTLQKKP